MMRSGKYLTVGFYSRRFIVEGLMMSYASQLHFRSEIARRTKESPASSLYVLPWIS